MKNLKSLGVFSYFTLHSKERGSKAHQQKRFESLTLKNVKSCNQTKDNIKKILKKLKRAVHQTKEHFKQMPAKIHKKLEFKTF